MSDVKNVVEYIDISKLSKWDINPRTISNQSLEDLKYKINKYKFFMEARPILVNVKKEKPSEYIVFAGNQRLEAIKQLGWTEAPVIIFNDLSQQTQKELAIIDNHNDGEWNLDILEASFNDIDFSKLGLKIPAIEIPTMFNSQEQQATKQNEVKAEQNSYPINNDLTTEEENLEEEQDNNKKHICPHCGFEFED